MGDEFVEGMRVAVQANLDQAIGHFVIEKGAKLGIVANSEIPEFAAVLGWNAGVVRIAIGPVNAAYRRRPMGSPPGRPGKPRLPRRDRKSPEAAAAW